MVSLKASTISVFILVGSMIIAGCIATTPDRRIDAQALFEECEVQITLDTVMVGEAFVEGRRVILNYPNINKNIRFGLHPSVMQPDRSGFSHPRGLYNEFFPVTDLVLHRDWWEYQFGEGALELQVLTDVMYVHYKAWQHEANDAYLEYRNPTSFRKYLEGIDTGTLDGTYRAIVRVDRTNVRPDTHTKIDPISDQIFLYADLPIAGYPRIGMNYYWMENAYDIATNELITVVTPHQHDNSLHQPEYPHTYRDTILALAHLSQHERFQWGPVHDEPSVSGRKRNAWVEERDRSVEIGLEIEDSIMNQFWRSGRWWLQPVGELYEEYSVLANFSVDSGSLDLLPLLLCDQTRMDGSILETIPVSNKLYDTEAKISIKIESPIRIHVRFTKPFSGEFGAVHISGIHSHWSKEWWEGIRRMYIINTGDNVELQIYDGSAESAAIRIGLPGVSPYEGLYIDFRDTSGKVFDVYDEENRYITGVDLVNDVRLSKPRMLFPYHLLYVGLTVETDEILRIHTLRLESADGL